MKDRDVIIKVEHVSKEYWLGNLDRHSFRDDLLHRKKNSQRKHIMALDDVSFEIERGEAVGLIGANGAGKSTLLKLLSRVTAPSAGKIYLDGSMSSMLEVGTGFHQELTGRENIYINGTILGMSRKEIDSKLEKIIEFSECREFIDTPVKRYSSGMYVKLAFSVAAYLESDIMILDEVLAVGDVKFQNKCLNKIHELSQEEGRTVLCVSHNMSTINKFCKRCLVMEHGKLIFDGDTSEAIREYYGENTESEIFHDYTKQRRFLWLQRNDIRLQSVAFVNKENATFWDDESLKMHFVWKYHRDIMKLCFRVEIRDAAETPIAVSFLYEFQDGDAGDEKSITAEVDIRSLKQGKYTTIYTLFTVDANGESTDLDCVDGLSFEKRISGVQKIVWNPKSWGYIELPEMRIQDGNVF